MGLTDDQSGHEFIQPGLKPYQLVLSGLQAGIHKAVGMVGVSSSPFGGPRVIESMVPMVRGLGLVVTFTDLYFTNVQNLFDEKGDMKDQAYTKQVKEFLDELVFMSRVLQWGRNNLPSKHHS